jgi:hypothetical protein
MVRLEDIHWMISTGDADLQQIQMFVSHHPECLSTVKKGETYAWYDAYDSINGEISEDVEAQVGGGVPLHTAIV